MKWQSASINPPQPEQLEISEQNTVSRTITATKWTLDKNEDKRKEEVNTIDHTHEKLKWNKQAPTELTISSTNRPFHTAPN